MINCEIELILTWSKNCVLKCESKCGYSHHDPIKLGTKSIELSLCDYSDAYILDTGKITVTRTIAAAPDANPTVQKK